MTLLVASLAVLVIWSVLATISAFLLRSDKHFYRDLYEAERADREKYFNLWLNAAATLKQMTGSSVGFDQKLPDGWWEVRDGDDA